MNATLKSICGLLNHSNIEMSMAAVTVLGAIRTREPGVHKALGELLVTTTSPEMFKALLDTIEASSGELSLKYLLKVLCQEGDHHDRVLGIIAQIGGKVVAPIKQQFDRVTPATQCRMVRVLPRIRTTQAHAFLINCFFNRDHNVVRDAVHALREEMPHYTKSERADIYSKLIAALKDKRLKNNEAALSAIIISLGILADPRSRSKLVQFVGQKNPSQIRRHALMSMSHIEYTGDKHQNIFDALFPILEEKEYDHLVRYAVQVLMRIKPKRSDAAKFRELLNSRHTGVVIYAIHALSQIDSITHANLVLAFLSDRDPHLRGAAVQALRNMPSSVQVILKAMDETDSPVKGHEMVKILEAHSNRIQADQAKAMVKHMLELYRKGDSHYELYRSALRHLRGDILQKEVKSLAQKEMKKKKYGQVRDYLKLLDGTDLLTLEIRYILAIAKLKTSKKGRSRTFRLADYCLNHISVLLRDDPKAFKKKFLAEKNLAPEDILYVGFHFSEQLNEERRFGADLLRHVVKKWSRREVGKVAKKKLKIEGH